mmetsp:Transcript_41409/g.46171  ORF Transcript_41409/g.46171 Transcript_41409/m.46171 type:complete len:84 (+) Transcript_41409:299-550(+)
MTAIAMVPNGVFRRCRTNRVFFFAFAFSETGSSTSPVAAVAAVAAAADGGGVNVEELVQLADTQGPDAALQWVKQQQQQQHPQ